MPQHLTQGHTYAIGLSQRANLAEAANTARAQGWSLPPAYLAGPIFYGGWSPVVYYAVQASPVAPPPDVAWLTQWIAIAYRSGQSATAQGYAGEVSALTPFGPELTFVQDLNAPPSVVRSLVADPAPGSMAWDAANGQQPVSDTTLEDVRLRGAWGGWIGLAAGVAGGVLLTRKTKHPIGYGIPAALVGAFVGSAVGTVAAVQLGGLPEKSAA